MSKKLRDFVKEGGNGERWIHVQLPCLSEHNTHPIGTVRNKTVCMSYLICCSYEKSKTYGHT